MKNLSRSEILRMFEDFLFVVSNRNRIVTIRTDRVSAIAGLSLTVTIDNRISGIIGTKANGYMTIESNMVHEILNWFGLSIDSTKLHANSKISVSANGIGLELENSQPGGLFLTLTNGSITVKFICNI